MNNIQMTINGISHEIITTTGFYQQLSFDLPGRLDVEMASRFGPLLDDHFEKYLERKFGVTEEKLIRILKSAAPEEFI